MSIEENPITAKQFAEWCKKTTEIREASWFDDEAGGGYAMTFYDAAQEAGVPAEWIEPISQLVQIGYSELWDWCNDQGVYLGGR